MDNVAFNKMVDKCKMAAASLNSLSSETSKVTHTTPKILFMYKLTGMTHRP